MNLKEFLKPTKGKVILFAVLLLIYAVFWLIPVYYNILFNIFADYTAFNIMMSEQNIKGFYDVNAAINPIQMIVTIIAEIAAIYLLSCIIIVIKNKIKKV